MKIYKRKCAIRKIAEYKVKELTVAEREDRIVELWYIDEKDEEFHLLSKELQQEIKINSDDSPNQEQAVDKRYDELLILVIMTDYYGIKNTFIIKELYHYTGEKVQLEEESELLLTCSCCGYKTLERRGEYIICNVCLWEDDGTKYRSTFSSCNGLTLKDAQENFRRYGVCEEKLLDSVDKERFEKYDK